MIDYSLCINNKCLKKDSCRRYLIQPDLFWQSYVEFNPDKYGNCDGFLKLDTKKKGKKKT